MKTTPEKYKAWKTRVKRLLKDGLVFKICHIRDGRGELKLSFWVEKFPDGWTTAAKDEFNAEFSECIENIHEQFRPRREDEIEINEVDGDLFSALQQATKASAPDFSEMKELNSPLNVVHASQQNRWPNEDTEGLRFWHCPIYSSHKKWARVKGFTKPMCVTCQTLPLPIDMYEFGEGEDHPEAIGARDTVKHGKGIPSIRTPGNGENHFLNEVD